MILGVDIGNTTVAIGIVDNGKLLWAEKIMTDISEIEINYRDKITRILRERGVGCIIGAVISSVVPLMTGIVKTAIAEAYGVEPIIITHKTAVGIKLLTDEPEKVGGDRIADAVGAVYEYGAPLIIIDMGTATTFSVINEECGFLGGMIMPGVRTALNSLIRNAALLPQIKLSSPPGTLIGKNTCDSIESGIVYGTAACIDEVCVRLSEELGADPRIIVTGGNAEKIVPYCRQKMTLDKYLLFKGMDIIYKNMEKV